MSSSDCKCETWPWCEHQVAAESTPAPAQGENAPTKPQCGRCKVSAPTLAKGWSFNGGKDTWVHHDQAGMAFACFNPPENAPVNTVQGADEKWPFGEAPEMCPTCDSREFISSGPKHLICYRCLLLRENTTLRAQIKQMAEALEKVAYEHGCDPGLNIEEDELMLCSVCKKAMKALALYREGQPK